MKTILIHLLLLFFVSFSYGQASCNIEIQGGVDNWPWSVVQPFPWDSIQGVWKLNSDANSTFFRMRVIATNSKRKILTIEKISDGNCAKPEARGIGFINADEKTVVRMIVSDQNLRYQLTLAMFYSRDLARTVPFSLSCDDSVLAASMQVIGRKANPSVPIDINQFEPVNMVLKKVPGSIDSICKKQAPK